MSICVFVIAVASCTQHAKNTVSSLESPKGFDLDSADFVVLEFGEDSSFLFDNARKTTLSRSELVEIERVLEGLVHKHNFEQRKRLEIYNSNHPSKKETETGDELILNDKVRQYVPVVNGNGDKEVWINFFCDPEFVEIVGMDWRSEIVRANDGRNCYFSVKINLPEKTHSDLRINGPHKLV